MFYNIIPCVHLLELSYGGLKFMSSLGDVGLLNGIAHIEIV